MVDNDRKEIDFNNEGKMFLLLKISGETVNDHKTVKPSIYESFVLK